MVLVQDDSMQPLISIIIPVFRSEKYLPALISDIKSQSFVNWELLLVDDGSPDQSGALCDAYAASDSRITAIHKPNGGISSTCNAGIKAAKGEWLFFCDHDDNLPSNSLSLFFDAISSHDTDLVAASYIRYEEQRLVPDSVDTKTETLSVSAYIERACNSICANPHARLDECYLWDKLLRADIVRENNLLFREDIHYFQDVLFVVQYIVHCKKSIYCLNKPVYIYYKRSVGESSNLTHCYNPIKSPGRFYSAIYSYNLVNDSGLSKKAVSYLKQEILESYYRLVFQLLHSKTKSFKDFRNFSRMVFKYNSPWTVFTTWITRHFRLKRQRRVFQN